MNVLESIEPNSWKEIITNPECLKFITEWKERNEYDIFLFEGPSLSGKTFWIKQLTKMYKKENVCYIEPWHEQSFSTIQNTLMQFCYGSGNVKIQKCIIVDDLDQLSENCQYLFTQCIDQYLYQISFYFSCQDHTKIVPSLISRIIQINLVPPTIEQITIILNQVNNNIQSKFNCTIPNNIMNHYLSIKNINIPEMLKKIEHWLIISLSNPNYSYKIQSYHIWIHYLLNNIEIPQEYYNIDILYDFIQTCIYDDIPNVAEEIKIQCIHPSVTYFIKLHTFQHSNILFKQLFQILQSFFICKNISHVN